MQVAKQEMGLCLTFADRKTNQAHHRRCREGAFRLVYSTSLIRLLTSIPVQLVESHTSAVGVSVSQHPVAFVWLWAAPSVRSHIISSHSVPSATITPSCHGAASTLWCARSHPFLSLTHHFLTLAVFLPSFWAFVRKKPITFKRDTWCLPQLHDFKSNQIIFIYWTPVTIVWLPTSNSGKERGGRLALTLNAHTSWPNCSSLEKERKEIKKENLIVYCC